MSQPATQQQQPAQQVSEKDEELRRLMTELFARASELAMASGEITEEMIRHYPVLSEIRDLILDVSRIIRRISKLARR